MAPKTNRLKNDPTETVVEGEGAPREGRSHSASYSKIRGEPFKWYVRVVGPHAEKFSGRTVPVTTKGGADHDEDLARMIWNGTDRRTGENVALYEFIAKPKADVAALDDVIPF